MPGKSMATAMPRNRAEAYNWNQMRPFAQFRAMVRAQVSILAASYMNSSLEFRIQKLVKNSRHTTTTLSNSLAHPL